MSLASRHITRPNKGQGLASNWGKQSQSIGYAFERDFWRHAVFKALPAACVRYPEQPLLHNEGFEVLNKTGLLRRALAHSTPGGLVLGSFLSFTSRNTILDADPIVKFQKRNGLKFSCEWGRA